MKGLIFVLLLAVALTIASAAIPRPRITNAKTRQFSFEVSLKAVTYNYIYYSGSRWCEGSLISPEWIVTSASCINKVLKVTAYLGSTQSEIKTDVLETIIHSGWYREEDDLNNIALLRIAPVTLGSNINVANLPPLSSSSLSPLYVNETIIASVGGEINDNGDSIEKQQYAHMRIVPNLVCSYVYGLEGSVESSFICAVKKIGTPCAGETGGPVVTESTNTLIGLTTLGTSFGCLLDLPVIFNRVSTYRSWILEKTGV